MATPIRTWELLVTKGLGAAGPGIAVTWGSYAALVVAARPLVNDRVFAFIVEIGSRGRLQARWDAS